MTAHSYEIGLHKRDLDTPALLIDLDVMEQNLATMAAFTARGKANVRPHVKLHKATPVLAYKQLAAGGVGVTCAKLGEAEVMAQAGIRDILIANQIVGKRKIARLVSLASYSDVMVGVDNYDNVAEISAAASAAGVQVRVLVEINIGHNRCGVAPSDALELAQTVAASPGLRFMGLMAYDGHLTLKVEPAEREVKSIAANRLLVETRRHLEAAGLPIEVVSASGTFTYRYATQVEGITEFQAGTYLLMDTTFRAHGITEFGLALSVLGTIISRPTHGGADNLAIIDVGRKTMDTGWGVPSVKNPADASVTSMSQEHGRMVLDESSKHLKVGDQVELWVSDCNTTINLYDKFYALRGDIVEAVWDIPGRGAST